MCVSSWGRNTYARVLIEVSTDQELKNELVIAIPVGKEMGHSLTTISIEYEWRPPRCSTCLIFDHVSDKCPKLPKVVTTQNVADDGFVVVKKKKSKSKNKHHKQVDGVKLSKPSLNLHYRKVDKGHNSSDNGKNIKEPNVKEKAAVDKGKVQVSNSFNALDNDDDEFWGGHAIFQPYCISDHLPAVLCLPSAVSSKQRPFKFTNILVHNTRFKEVRDLDRDPFNSVLRDEEALYVQAFNDAVLLEERFLKQKPKVDWLRDGDANTAYFHKSVKSRVSRSQIDVVMNSEALYVQAFNDAVLLEERFLKQKPKVDWLRDGDANTTYFHKSVKSHVSRSQIDVVMNSEDDVAAIEMIREVSDQEIKDAIFSMGNDKSSGPDGYTASFFKEAKIIANHIKESLKMLVSSNQSAFVPGRNIADNILLTQELMHNYHLDRGPPRCVFKNKSLSIAGRLQLIQLVVGSLHVFWASVFVLPAHVLLDIEQIMRGFLWSHSLSQKGQAKVTWDVVCLPRKEGGLGVALGPMDSCTQDSWSKLLGNSYSWDEPEWRNLDGVVKPFSVSAVWHVIRPKGDVVLWYHCVWFTGCIPRHAFNMLLIMKRRLKTQDMLRAWDNVDVANVSCALCELQADSRDHLFFECIFSTQVWRKVRVMAGLPSANHSMDSIIHDILPFANRKNSKSVCSKLVLAASAYFIWQERNNRLFRNERRSVDQVAECILNSVRLKLISCRWKKLKATGLVTVWHVTRFVRVKVHSRATGAAAGPPTPPTGPLIPFVGPPTPPMALRVLPLFIVVEERPCESIDVLVAFEQTQPFEPQGSPHDSR
nr:hypothetical protein [Tanacetum cinerariifolium]